MLKWYTHIDTKTIVERVQVQRSLSEIPSLGLMTARLFYGAVEDDGT